MAMRGSTHFLAHFLALAVFMVIGINMLCNFYGVTAQFCKGTSLSEIRFICDKSVTPSGPEVPPSSDCCYGMTPANLPCLCKRFTKEVEEVMSPKKVVDVARTCGVSAPAGLQCGSYKVPPPHA